MKTVLHSRCFVVPATILGAHGIGTEVQHAPIITAEEEKLWLSPVLLTSPRRKVYKGMFSIMLANVFVNVVVKNNETVGHLLSQYFWVRNMVPKITMAALKIYVSKIKSFFICTTSHRYMRMQFSAM